MPSNSSENSLAGDRLRGAKAIGDFIGESEKRVYYLAERGYLPLGKIGATLIASKTALRAHHERLTRGTIETHAPTPSLLAPRTRTRRHDGRPRSPGRPAPVASPQSATG
jgi:hypothetical protein